MAQRDMRGGNYAAELEAPEVYRQRRRNLAERIDGGTIVMWGAGDDRRARLSSISPVSSSPTRSL